MSKEKQLYEILRTLQKGEIGTDLAHLQILRLFDVSTRTFKMGDKVQWRGMGLIVVEVGVNEILIATSENVDDENYNDWWVGTQYVC